ncbi:MULTISPECIES: CHASE3 domain-containing protein [unclassified Novosphingobium]|uniref:sensor histidine kinase n=1 Tax=unclassified Novosphingobium TaxID=2644732 RepID=UPI00144623CE|nr:MULTISPECIES: CHASE3 domain-containing protein [unclassified Novosphingobium]NKJ42838.1 two-component sensor histidine kinase [Novosphingobium sp. SG720]NMN05526.1 two-component sensor histidine kinase [Novosphingobium sp. SG919]NMN88115.1 two-component sensor histidine kinase [Novosphingobium sp. SG916]
MVADETGQAHASGHIWRRRPAWLTLALFAVLVLALLGTFALIFATVDAERVQREQAARTSAVLAALDGIVAATLNGETGQRGYYITYDRRYLEPYDQGHAAYLAEIRALRRRLGREIDPQQAALVDEIERLGDAKWAEMAGTVELVRRGELVEARVRTLSDEGQLAMEGLRQAVGRLERTERARLDAATDSAAVAEARVVPSLGLLAVIIAIALVLGLWQVIRTAQAQAAAANAALIAEARDRADLLARELNHRVKNLFAVILAIVKMSARGDTAAAPAVDRIAKRIHALVTAHDVTQGRLDGEGEVDLADLVAKAIAPYRSDSERCNLAGGALVVSGRHAVPLGLVLHELVTNAVKYGAWAAPGGLLEVRWGVDADKTVRLVWQERAAAPLSLPEDGVPAREGFGSALIRSSERQLGGRIVRRFSPEGIMVEITFPHR